MKVTILLGIAYVLSATFAQDSTFEIVCNSNPLMTKQVDNLHKEVDSVSQTVNNMKGQVDQVQLLLENQVKDLKVEVDKLAKMLEKVIENKATIWRPLKTGTYAFLGEPCTWYEAMAKCKELGGYLVEITSQEEQDLIVRTSQALGWDKLKLNFWLGLNDIEKEGTWIWEQSQRGVNDGFSNWHAGEPSGGNENCGATWTGNKWNDYPCDNKKKLGEQWTPAAVCERDG
eukprot:GFUD01067515.1.p1 GENE.GFUD01067515.1~~GFUD01067515.1.p1  ORF type:complete len:229 (+),score=46.25 GFUD01067515.1:42-728(+)